MKKMVKFYERVLRFAPGDFRARKWVTGTWMFLIGVAVGLIVCRLCF